MELGADLELQLTHQSFIMGSDSSKEEKKEGETPAAAAEETPAAEEAPAEEAPAEAEAEYNMSRRQRQLLTREPYSIFH